MIVWLRKRDLIGGYTAFVVTLFAGRYFLGWW